MGTVGCNFKQVGHLTKEASILLTSWGGVSQAEGPASPKVGWGKGRGMEQGQSRVKQSAKLKWGSREGLANGAGP